MANTVRFKAEMDDGVSAKLRGISAAFDKIGGKGSGASLFGNIGAKAVAKGFSLIDTAASGLIDVLGNAMDAAREDQDSIAKLDAALRANIPGWDGNRDAIERVIASRQRLGFTDEEQRSSMALLVAAGDDVTTSLQLQATAMDLARLKHISLEDATTALIKTEDGHYRILQGLGIQLADNATAQDAVNAVQKVANGQAAAFADTDGGKQLARQIQINEAMEKIGYVLLPVVATAMEALATVAVPAIEAVAGALGVVFGLIGKIIDGITTLIGKFGDLGHELTAPASGPMNNLQYLMSGMPGHAAGGWVGLNGPEIAVVGEQGPEYIVPNGGGTGAPAGVTLQGVTEAEIDDMIERRMYFRLQRAAPTVGPA